jgi:predicted permease
MEQMIVDLRQALRSLRRTPAVALAVVLSLGLGIGANATVFSFVNALLLPPLPVEAADGLVAVYTTDAKTSSLLPTSLANFRDFRDSQQAFEGLLAQMFVGVSIGKGVESERVLGQLVSASYFSLLGLAPSAGRGFVAAEDEIGAPPTAVLSYDLWLRRFASDPEIVGREITLNGHGVTVVGVAPRGFGGTAVALAPQLWVPLAAQNLVLGAFPECGTERRAVCFEVIGRLKRGSTPSEAKASLALVAERLEREFPDANRGRGVGLVPLLQARIDPNARSGIVFTLAFLMAVVGLVLLITCANVAHLMLARVTARRRELGVRLALGAGRARVARLWLSEGLLLSAAGGAVGLLFASWASRALWDLRPATPVPISLEPTPDAGVLGFTIAVAVLTGALFAAGPAWSAANADPVAALEGSTGPKRARWGVRNLLVVGQVGVSLTLLLTAGLFLRSMKNAQAIDPGFEFEDTLVFSVDLALHGYAADERGAVFEGIASRVATLPGVRSVAWAQRMPLTGGPSRSVFLEGEASSGETGILVQTNIVGEGYFGTLGIELLQGRLFGTGDLAEAPPVAVVNQAMAERFWPGRQANEMRFRLWGRQEFHQVVGVVRDAKYNSLGENPQPYLYLPLEQNPVPGLSLHVRSDGAPGLLLGAVRAAVRDVEPGLPLYDLDLLSSSLTRSLWPARMAVALLTAFGALALFLTGVGVYGVVSHAAEQRTREVGIRVALGGRRGQIVRMILSRGVTLVGVGIAIGWACGTALGSILARLLYGVGAVDLPTFAGASALIIAVGTVASYLPARRAAAVQPTVALRHH